MSTNSDKAHQIALAATRIADHAEDVRRLAGEIERAPGTSVVKSSTLNRLLNAAEAAIVGFPVGHGPEQHEALKAALDEFHGRHPRVDRIVLRPGYVTSRTDGDRHWIGVGQLIELYRLTPEERRRAMTEDERTHFLRPETTDIILSPRYDGNYDRVAAGLDPKPPSGIAGLDGPTYTAGWADGRRSLQWIIDDLNTALAKERVITAGLTHDLAEAVTRIDELTPPIDRRPTYVEWMRGKAAAAGWPCTYPHDTSHDTGPKGCMHTGCEHHKPQGAK